jgi:hypothetical protein
MGLAVEHGDRGRGDGRSTMMRWTLAVGGVALALLVWPAPSSFARAGEPKGEKGEEGAFCQALERTIEGELPLDQVRLGVLDRTDAGLRSMTIYGDGVGIWNGERQFTVKRRLIKKMLKMIERAKFCEMENSAEEEEDDALRVIRGVSLTIGTLTKSVNQMERHADAQGIEALAAALLDTCQKDGESGVAASSLQDGLDKLLNGALAPEVLSISANAPAREGTAEGWLLQIHGREVVAQPHGTVLGYGAKRRARLSDAEFHGLVKELTQADPGAIPANVYATGYTDLSVSLLNQRKTVQARAFAGMAPDANRPAQEAFEKLREALHALYVRIAGGAEQ